MGLHDGSDDRYAGRAGGRDPGGVGGGDAADGDDGDLDGLGDGGEGLGPDALVADILGSGAEDGATADVVGAGVGGVAGAGGVVGGVADVEGRGACRVAVGGAASGRDGQVVGPEVDAVGLGGEGDVDAVVDEEEGVVGACQVAEAGRLAEQVGGVGVFVAELDGGRAGLEGEGDGPLDAAVAGEPGVGYDDEPEVRDGPQREPLPGVVSWPWLRSRWIRALSRLWSARWRLNTWLPSSRATK